MARAIIAVGSAGNDGTGDTLRGGAIKINANFEEVYSDIGALKLQTADSVGALNIEGITFDQRAVVFIGEDSVGDGDNNETFLQATEPTSDNYIKLPDSSGTIALLSDLAGLDSAEVKSLVRAEVLDSAKVLTLIEQNSLDSATVGTVIDSSFIKAQVTLGVDSDAAIALIQDQVDSNYINNNINTSQFLDSTHANYLIRDELTSVGRNIIPDGHRTRNIGDSATAFKDIYARDFHGRDLHVDSDIHMGGNARLRYTQSNERITATNVRSIKFDGGNDSGTFGFTRATGEDQFFVTGSVRPFADNDKDLGDSALRWRDIYVSNEIKIGATGSFATITEAGGVLDLPSGTTLNGVAISTGGGGGGGDSNSGNAILHDSEGNIFSYNTDNPDAGAQNNIAIGNDAGSRLTTGDDNILIGRNAGADATNGANTGYQQVVIGYNAKGGGQPYRTVAIGASAQAIQNLNVAVGYNALSAGSGQNVAVGASSNAQGTDTIALGSSTTATANNAVTLGPNVTNGSAGRLVIGSSNTTDLRCQDTTITSLSDKRDKVEINDLTIGLNFVNDVTPKYFRRNDRARYYTPTYTQAELDADPSLTQSWNFDSDAHVAAGEKNERYEFGWIAQDVETALPSGYADSARLTFEEDIGDTRFSYDVQRFTAGDMLPILWKAVQELSTKYDNLDSDHTALKARVAALESN